MKILFLCSLFLLSGCGEREPCPTLGIKSGDFVKFRGVKDSPIYIVNYKNCIDVTLIDPQTGKIGWPIPAVRIEKVQE